MAGIYDRIGTDDNIPVHFLTSALVMAVGGLFTDQQIIDRLNAEIQTPLSGAAQTDLSNLKAELASKATAGERAEYMWRIEAAGIALEVTDGAQPSDADFRTWLNIA